MSRRDLELNRRILDFLLGVGYPETQQSAFASSGAGGRPQFTETQATSFSPWPGVANLYDGNGNPLNPSRFLAGQNAAVGIALGFVELRAWMLGLLQPYDVSKHLAGQYYRLAHGIATVLGEQALTNDGVGLSQAEYSSVIRRLFSLAGDLAALEQQIITVNNSIPTIDADLLALAALTGTGFPSRIATDTWALRMLQAPAAGFTITNPAGIAGDPTFVLSDDLAALEALATTGLAVRTGAAAWALRTITSLGSISITNPGGVAGNIVLDVSSTVSNGPLYYKGSVDTTDATPTNVLTTTYSIPNNTGAEIEAWLTVKKADLSQSAGWHFVGLFRNNGGVVTQDGDTDFLDQPPQLQSAAWAGGTPAFVISGTSINLQATGVIATNYTHAGRMAVHEN